MLSIRTVRQTKRQGKLRIAVSIWILRVISFPFRLLYRVLNRIFDLDRRGAESNLRRLTREVENQYDFLFSEHGGRILPELSSGDPAMDFATVVIELSDLYVRAMRDRGYTQWFVSLNGAEHSWKSLDPILKKISPPESLPYSEYQGLRFHLSEIQQLLRSKG
jgi:hypothetical protein